MLKDILDNTSVQQNTITSAETSKKNCTATVTETQQTITELYQGYSLQHLH